MGLPTFCFAIQGVLIIKNSKIDSTEAYQTGQTSKIIQTTSKALINFIIIEETCETVNL